MSRNQRIGLVVAALAVAVIAFAVARPGDDEDSEPSTTTTPAETESSGGAGTDTEAEQPPAEPEVTRIRLQGGEVDGGAKSIEVARDDTVRIVVSSDAPDQLHLHGYDIEREAAPGRPARFRFEADAEGEFVFESHTAEHAGKEPVIARLLVGPS